MLKNIQVESFTLIEALKLAKLPFKKWFKTLVAPVIFDKSRRFLENMFEQNGQIWAT